MRKMKWLAAAVLLAVPVWAWAQVVAQDGQRTDPGRTNTGPALLIGGINVSDTTMRLLRVDASGYLKMMDADRDRNAYRTGTLINNQLGASGVAMADSSTPVATYDLRRIGLMFYPQEDSLSSVVRIAVQVRAHSTTGSDSASAFPWLRWSPQFTATAQASFRSDSIGHLSTPDVEGLPLTAVQSTSANSSNSGLNPGEFMVVFSAARNDSTGVGNGKPWSYPKGIYLPLVGTAGEWFWAPYMTVRVRVINGVRSRFRLRVDYVGTPL